MHHDITGRTDPAAETIVLSAGLGGAGAFWQPQMAALNARFRVISYDQRGTGRNTEALPDNYSIGHMADDVIAMLELLGISKCHFMGHALGGIVGLEIALRKPSLLGKLVLVNAWAKADSHTARCFAVRKHLLLNTGVEAYVQAQPIFLYPAAWLSQNAERVAQEEKHGIAHFQGADTILKRIGALLAFDVSGRLNDIRVPTLVAVSRDDVLVPWTASQILADGLPDAELWMVREGGHGFTVTEPDAFNARMLSFLAAET
jgi:aminoacrylate hydrolase